MSESPSVLLGTRGKEHEDILRSYKNAFYHDQGGKNHGICIYQNSLKRNA